jgi:hypothetical protein
MSLEPFAPADQLTAADRWFQVIRNHMALTQGKLHENSCLKSLRVKQIQASLGVKRVLQLKLMKIQTWYFRS